MRVTRLLSAASAVSAVVTTLAVAPVLGAVTPAAAAVRTAAVAPSPTGSVSMVAGGFGHGTATSLRANPTALAYSNGTLYVGETTSTAYLARAGFVRRIDLSDGSTTIVAGGGTRSLTDLPTGLAATRFSLNYINGLAVDGSGRLVVSSSDRVFAVDDAGKAIELTRSSGTYPSTANCGVCTGQLGARPFVQNSDVAVTTDGSLLLAHGRVFRVGPDSRTWTLAGGNVSVEGAGLRENIPGVLTAAIATSVAPDGHGGAFFTTRRSGRNAAATNGDALRHVDGYGIVATVAQDSTVAVSDPALPTDARVEGLGSPLVVRAVSDGLLLATTTGVWHRSISGAWAHLAGGGTTAPADSAAALGTSLVPTALAPDDYHGFFVATTDRVWHVNGDGVLHLVEGTGGSYAGDGGQATDATFAVTSSVARGPDGTTYISDSSAHVIRSVSPDGRIRTFAGTGSAIASGDGGAATDAGLGAIGRIATDGAGNLYLIDGDAVREINTSGIIRTVVGNGTTTPDLSGPVTATTTSIVPTDLAAAPDGTLYIAERSRKRVRKVAPDGTMTTPVDVQSTGARFDVLAVAVDGDTLYVSDAGTPEIWKSATGGATTPYVALPSYAPGQLVVDGAHHLYGLFGQSNVARINADGSQQVVIGNAISLFLPRFADSLDSADFPIAPVEAEAPGSIASDGADGLVGTEYGAVLHYAALGSGVIAPARPQGVRVSAGDGGLYVSWAAPSSTTSPTPTSYTITASPGGGSVTVNGMPQNAVLVPGLASGTTYSITVQATNAGGTSYPSRPVAGTTSAPAVQSNAPSDVAAWILPDGRVGVTWRAPASNTGMSTAYQVLAPWGPAGENITCSAGCDMFQAISAPAGVAATYRVVVTSPSGRVTSGPSNEVTASAPLQAPTNVRVISHNSISTTVWDGPPVTPGHPISAVCVSTASGWGTCASGNARAISLPSQTPGTAEQVTLQVGNDFSSALAAPVSVTAATATPPAAPSAVSGLVASTNWHAVHVTWTSPTSGSPVRDSIVTLLPEGRSFVIAGNLHTADFTGVAPGTSHIVSVTTDGDGGAGSVVTSNEVSLPADPPGLFVPLEQARVFSAWLGYSNGPATDDDITIANRAGIPENAEAVLVNVEVQSPTQAGYLRVTPWQSTSSTAVQEFAAGQTVSNLVAVKLGPGGTIELHLSGGSATVYLDVEGAFVPTGTGDTFKPLAQARAYGPGSVTAGTDRDVVVAGHAGVPVGADAALVNVEVQSPTKSGYLRVTPGGSASSTAVQEFAAGQTISNLVAVKLGPGGTIRLHLSAGTATVFVDVAGAFISNGPGDGYRPVPQARVYGPGALTAGSDRDVVIAGHGGIPANADAVVINVEVQSPTKAGYLRVTPGGTTSQTAVQEFSAGQTISALVPVKLGPGGTIRLHLSAGTATVFIDVAGAFTSA